MKSDGLARVRRAFAAILNRQGYVSVVDVLVEMQSLTPAHLEDWRFGRVPYLERVVQGNLSKLSAIVREIRRVAEEQGLKPSETVYRKWGKGPDRPLRFSKHGEAHVEQAYATHWVSRRNRSPRPADATGEEASTEARIGHEDRRGSITGPRRGTSSSPACGSSETRTASGSWPRPRRSATRTRACACS